MMVAWKLSGAGQGKTVGDAHAAGRRFAGDMACDDRVQAIQRLLFDHQAAAAVAIGIAPLFFAGLEEQTDLAGRPLG